MRWPAYPSRGRWLGWAALAAALPLALSAQGTPWQALATGSRASLRGLSVVNDRVVWASGSGGTVLRTVDRGLHWEALPVPGAERLDFRDIKAFSAQVAYAMAIAQSGGIYKTTDGGRHWTRQYASNAPGFFLDSLAFWDARHGLALGDPEDGHFLVLRTEDGGAHWTPVDTPPTARADEGAFAASGSALVAVQRGGKHEAWFATGGPGSGRVFHTADGGYAWTVVTSPLSGATAGAGIFSLAFADARHGVAVGGDYTHPGDTARTAAYSRDGGRTWQAATIAPTGYRSGVTFLPGGSILVAVGPNGTDVSRDGGSTWVRIAPQGFNAVAARGADIWAAGSRGAIARMVAAALGPGR